jgi:hypothetical protein
MAGRAELGGLLSHERLQKGLAVWFRIQVSHEVDQAADHLVLAGHQLM